MALFSFFKKYKHQQYGYIPRYYNPDKEARERELQELRIKHSNSSEGTKARIQDGFKRRGRTGQTDADVRRRMLRRSNTILLAVIVVLAILSWAFIEFYLPGILQSLERFD